MLNEAEEMLSRPRNADVNFGDVLALPVFAVFALAMLFPSTHQEIKLPVFALALLCATSFIFCSRGHLYLHKTIVLWVSFYTTIGIVWVTIGVLNDNPGALPVAPLYTIYPLAYLAFINQLSNRRYLIALSYMFVISCGLVVTLDIGFVLEKLGVIPGTLFSSLGNRNLFGALVSGDPSYGSNRMSMSLFYIPAFVALVIYKHRQRDSSGIVILSYVLLAGFLILMLLSNRRAVYVVALASPVIALALHGFVRQQIYSRNRLSHMLPALAVFCAVVVWTISQGFFSTDYFDVILDNFLEGFEIQGTRLSGSSIARARELQTYVLFEGWVEQPWIGTGHGATADVIRNLKTPWAFELTYLQILYHTGIVGLLLYAAGVAWIMAKLVEIMQTYKWYRLHAYVLLNGMIGFLLGSVSNPYLLSFDRIWVIFIPVLFINYHLMHEQLDSRLLKAAASET